MAGSQIATSVTILNSLKGFQAISLTEYDTSAAAAIASGSVVEIAGAYFTFAGDETINASSWTAVTTGTTAYIELTPAGTAGSQVVTAAYSSTAPTWRDDLQGWYASAASNSRAIGSVYKAEATNYARKYIIDSLQQDYGRNYRWRGEVERITSGSGNWTVPAGVYKIRVTCVGGGGGGGEGFNGGVGANGSNGGNTTFTGAITGFGGSGGTGGSNSVYGVLGGAGAAGGAGAPGENSSFGAGGGGAYGVGGNGGGAGGLGSVSTSSALTGAYGGGGGGGRAAIGGCGGGGGGGTNISLVTASNINTIPGTTIAYSVGAGGAGGTGGAGVDGAAGGSGIIIIEY